jgi:U3 small nucleolar RNA-associated protein 16
MFSRLLKSARFFLIDTPQTEIIPPSPVGETIEETMVTTRRKQVQSPVDDDLNEDNPIHDDVPASSKKRSRLAKSEDAPEMSAEEESPPPSTKRRKTLPLREREVESPEGDMEGLKGAKTHPVVEIPARKATPPKGQIGGVTSARSSEKEERQGVVGKKTHKRFGSEDLDEEFFSTARESNEGDLVDAPIVLSDEESEESDDDAPEAIGIQEAAQAIKLKDRDAAKVVKE